MPLQTPIIIGVGDIKNRSTALASAKEPATLMLEAIHAALADASPSPSALLAAIDSIDVVRTWTWPYPDLPGLLASQLGVTPGVKWLRYSEHGGDKPGKLVDEAARRIARGEAAVCVVTGGEALASLSACAAAKKLPPPGWTTPAQAVDAVFSPTGRDLGDNLGAVHGIGAPIHVYPLYENAFRAHRGQGLEENHRESARLYAEFSKVAEKQEFAWGHGRSDDEEVIARVGGRNRMICYPYPLLMNAFNTVNLASALILTSTATATALDIPRSKWIFPLAGAGTSDPPAFWNRQTYHASPSLSASLDAALARAHTRPTDIDLLDIYSCFPIVPKLAAAHLGIPLTGAKLSLLGGLTSFGGAGNNYSMHALTEMTRRLRAGAGRKGLVLCNGGVLSYMHVLVLSREPETEGAYPVDEGLPGVLGEGEGPVIDWDARGEAVVETYTVEFARDNTPLRGFIVGRLKSSNARFLANHGDDATLRLMAGGTVEIVGRKGWVWRDGEKKERGLFAFERPAML